MIRAIVLAGGKGTRFQPFTELIPKPMIPVGPEEKPVLEIILEWLKKHGIREAVLLCGYKWKYIKNYLGEGERLGIKILYSLDDENYSGSGGALLKAYKTILSEDRESLIWYGDILAPIDVKALLSQHRVLGSDATLVVTDSYRVPVGVAQLDEDNRVVHVEEKPYLKFPVTIGVLILKRDPVIKAEADLGKKFDIMGDLIPWMIRQGYNVRAFFHRDRWFDVGSLEKYVKLREDPLWEELK